jgi:hypothetical protein
MFGKVYASLYQGTLRGKAHPILVFTNLLATCDRLGNVDKHPRAIAEEVGLSLEETQAAITYLEAKDPESRSREMDGRRIVRLDDHRAWGWRIVNYVKYRALRDTDERRAAIAEAVRRHRNKKDAPAPSAPDIFDGSQEAPPSPPPAKPRPIPPAAQDFTAWHYNRRLFIAPTSDAGSGTAEDWRRLFRDVGIQAMTAAYDAILPTLPPNRKVGWLAIKTWLEARYTITPEA